MKSKKITIRRIGPLCALVATLSTAHAGLRTWDGGGANNFWMTADNWEVNTAPQANDDLLFPSGAARLSNSNNFVAGTSFNCIAFTGGGYDLRGTLITTRAGITNYNGSSTISAPLSLATNQTFSCEGVGTGLVLKGGVDTAGRTLTLSSAGEIQFQSGISGSGDIIKTGPQLVSMQANNTYLGRTDILQGTVILSHSNGLGATIAGTTVSPGATIQLEGTITVPEPLVLAGKIQAASPGPSGWSGSITLVSNTAIVDVPSIALPLTISGVISGTGTLAKVSSGTLWLTANNTYTGLTSNYFGTVIVDGFQPSSPVFVGLGATLAGNGTVGNVTCAEQITGQIPKVIPGQLGVGRLTTSNLTMVTVGHLAVQLAGTIAATGYGQVTVRGSVNITNAGLDLTVSNGFAPPMGSSFVIIDNDGNDPVLGEFRFFPEGTIINGGGYPFQISYHGGTGNDVVLTRVGSITGIQSIMAFSDSTRLQVTGGVSGLIYTIQAATNFTPPILWSNIGSAQAFSGQFAFFDFNAPLFPVRFYRVMSP